MTTHLNGRRLRSDHVYVELPETPFMQMQDLRVVILSLFHDSTMEDIV